MRLRKLGHLFFVPIIAVGSFIAVAATPAVSLAQEAITCAPPAATASTPAAAAASPAADADVAFPADAGTVDVFAASSLTDAFNAIGEDLEAANPGLDLVFNYAGSQALVTQLSEGASADVFASANTSQMKAATEAGVISGDSSIFAQNKLAIVVPKDNPAGIASFADLGKDGVKLVLAAADVPVGQYGRVAICNAGADTATYGDGFVESVAGNVVSNETNVKNVLAKVQLGEADAGIVYVTDVTSEVAADVTLIDIPTDINVIAKYPVAAVEGGDTVSADAFISYLLSADGQATLASFGFQSK
ncbi:MAG: molybdate ABC transporter substrate-binding protein [Thermomicrobiales bacterium]